MRPPQNAGGIAAKAKSSFSAIPRFNEAPAKRGGDCHTTPIDVPFHPAASMRPPQNAGGIFAPRLDGVPQRRGFNEAPAKRGGDYGAHRKDGAGFNRLQ